MRERFYWPGLEQDVSERIKTCDRCVKFKTPGKNFAELVNIQILLCIDFLSLERSKGKCYKHTLIILFKVPKITISVYNIDKYTIYVFYCANSWYVWLICKSFAKKLAFANLRQKLSQYIYKTYWFNFHKYSLRSRHKDSQRTYFPGEKSTELIAV